MTMKVEELIAGKKDEEKVSVDGVPVPVATIRRLHEQGYVHLNYYKDNRTFSLWGKTCTACFTLEQLQEMATSN